MLFIAISGQPKSGRTTAINYLNRYIQSIRGKAKISIVEISDFLKSSIDRSCNVVIIHGLQTTEQADAFRNTTRGQNDKSLIVYLINSDFETETESLDRFVSEMVIYNMGSMSSLKADLRAIVTVNIDHIGS